MQIELQSLLSTVTLKIIINAIVKHYNNDNVKSYNYMFVLTQYHLNEHY